MREKKTWPAIVAAVFMAITSTATSYGAQLSNENEDVTLSPYFYVEGADPSTDSFPLKGTKVTANINGVIAETYVTQTYANEGDQTINAQYVFPASTKVSVHGMKMVIGDKTVTAQIKEKEEAKQEYEEAKSEGKSASLLEQQRANVFTMNLANIMPGDVVEIELHYTELIDSVEGIYQFVFPTVVGPRYASPSEAENADANERVASPYISNSQEQQNATGSYDITVNLSSAVPITDVSSATHKIDVASAATTSATVTLADPEDFAGNRDFILDYKLIGEEINSGLMLSSGADENFFMLMVQPPEHYEPDELVPRDYVFVLDVSGSMYGFPLDTAKELIKNLVTNLRESDTFNVILFSGAADQMSPESLPATAQNIAAAIEFIDNEDGGGGTELAPALKTAIAIPKKSDVSRSIVVITDGYISGEREIFDIISSNMNTTNFFSFGIGSSVNRYLVDGIAKTGSGESFVVTDPAEAEETAKRFRTYVEAPLLTNIQVSYSSFDVYDIEPDNIPTLFAQRPIVIYGKWRGEPTGVIRIYGKHGNEDYIKEIMVSDSTPEKDYTALPYLWARKRVEMLTDYASDNSDPEAVKKEVTALGLKYSMMTPYTSFIAVIDIVRNSTGDSTDVDQPLPMPAQVSDLAVGGGYTIGSEPETILLISAVVLLLFVNIMVTQRKKRIL